MNILTRVVTKKIAELLKEKGFDKPCRHLYDKFGNLEMDPYAMDWNDDLRGDMVIEVISAPSIFSVLEWFFEKHKIWISVVYFKPTKTFIGKYEYLNEETYKEFVYYAKDPFEMYLIVIEYLLIHEII